MTYQCEACSYKGSHFKSGVCPGCGSTSVRNVAASTRPAAKARKPYRLLLACALWLYLAIEILRKLIG